MAAIPATAIGGNMTVKVNGQKLPLGGSAKITSWGAPERESQIGPDGAVGFTLKHKDAQIKGEVLLLKGFAVADLDALDDCTVLVEADSGHTYTMANAWLASKGELGDGKFEVVFAGRRIEETVG